MNDDASLLQRYVEHGDQAAFAELVQRHVGLVYHAALRQLGGDTHRAKEVTQLVFTDLARKARFLSRREVLASWLHTSTRFAVAKVWRSDTRRKRYETEAGAMPTHETAMPWENLRPLIDEAVHDLSEPDRAAVLLRYFEGSEFAAIGAALGVSEDAARMRVERALGKLQRILARRGITSSSAALATVLGAEAIAVAPAGLALSVTSSALVAGVPITGVAAWLGSMPVTFAAIAAAVSLASFNVVQQRHATEARSELARLQESNHALMEANLRASLAAVAKPPAIVPQPPRARGAGAAKGGRLSIGGREIRPEMTATEKFEILHPEGRSSPMRAWQTLLSAGRAQGPRASYERDVMPLLFCLDSTAGAKVNAFLTRLPADVRPRFQSPEALLAPVFDRWLWQGDPPRGYSPRDDVPIDGDPTRAMAHFEITRRSGSTIEQAFPFKRFDDGWRYGPLDGVQADELLALIDSTTGEPKP